MYLAIRATISWLSGFKRQGLENAIRSLNRTKSNQTSQRMETRSNQRLIKSQAEFELYRLNCVDADRFGRIGTINY